MKTIKKILFVLLIFGFTISPFFLAWNWSKTQLLEISSDAPWDDVSFWDVIISKDEKKEINIWDRVFITINPDSEFKLSSEKKWELTSWSINVSSQFDFNVIVGDVNIRSNDWSAQIIIQWDRVLVTSLHSQLELSFDNQLINLNTLYWVSIDTTEDYKNLDHFELVEKVGLKKTNLSISKPRFWNNFFSFSWNLNDKIFTSYLSLFSEKGKSATFNEKIAIFNNCSSFLEKTYLANDLKTQQWKRYNNIIRNCFWKEIIEDSLLYSLVQDNVRVIKSPLYRYELLDIANRLKYSSWISIDVDLYFLEKALLESNIDFAISLSKKIWVWLSSIHDAKKWAQIYQSINSIAATNIDFVPAEVIELKWMAEDRLLAISWDSLQYTASKLMDNHFAFSQDLIANARYDLLELTFDDRIFFWINKTDPEISVVYNSYLERSDMLNKSYVKNKENIHAASSEADDDDLLASIESRLTQEDELWKLLDELKKDNKRLVNTFSIWDIISAFEVNWYIVKKDDITAHIKSSSTFSISDVKYWNLSLSLDYDHKTSSVYNVEINWEKREGTLPLENLLSLINSEINPSYLDTEIWDIFNEVKPQDFSHEWLLKKELIKSYLDSIKIFSTISNISQKSADVYTVNNAYVEYNDKEKIWLSFDIVLRKWSIWSLVFTDEPDQRPIAPVVEAKELPVIAVKTYEVMKKRYANKIVALNTLSNIFIGEEDISIDVLKSDWFEINKTYNLKPWNWTLKWTFYAEEWIIKDATFKLNENISLIDSIWVVPLKEKMTEIESDEDTRITIENDIKKERDRDINSRIRKYSKNPEELINWDWIND